MDIVAGTTLGDRYELSSRIAVGGMGEVREATDRVIGRTVAVKIPSRNSWRNPASSTGSA